MPAKVLTEIAQGYFRSRVLCAAARLGVADALGDEERSVDQIAASCGAQPGSLYRLLRALASFGVVTETTPRHFALTEFGRPLRKDAPNSEWPFVVFWADLIADNWVYLTDCIRTGETAPVVRPEGAPSRWSQDPHAMDIFRGVMGTPPVEDYMPIALAWDFSKYHVVADLGGGGGGLIAAVLTAYPNLSGMLVERPDAVDAAGRRFEKEGLADRCKPIAADLLKEVPAGADIYMLKHVLHGYDDKAAIEILTNCRRVLPAEGRILVIEFILPDVVDSADPSLEQRLMSDLNMLAVTGGKERSAVEWRELLTQAGLDCRSIVPVGGDLVSIVEASC
ncbi:MAG: methyltransferase [Bryobacteraceae bacterium]|jgi:hypothetical protein